MPLRSPRLPCRVSRTQNLTPTGQGGGNQGYGQQQGGGGYESQGGGNQGYGQQQGGGGEQHPPRGGQNYGGGGAHGQDEDDMSGALQHAQQHGGRQEDEGMFSNILSGLGQNKQQIGGQGINEEGESPVSLVLEFLACFLYSDFPLFILLSTQYI